MASLALAVTGAAVGGVFGGTFGAQIGYAVGSIAGALLFPPKGQKVEGPRLQDLQIQSSAEGASIAQTYGSVRVAGNVIWGKPLSEHRHKEKSGGKGGGGGTTSVTYTYTADFASSLCEGPIDAVRKIWCDGKLIYDVSEPTAEEQAIADGGGYLADKVAALQASLDKTVKGGGTLRIHLGSETQLPDPLIEADLGAGNAPAYRGVCYLLFDNLALEDFGNRIPNITAEVVTGSSGLTYLGKQGPFPRYKNEGQAFHWFANYIKADRVFLAQDNSDYYASNKLNYINYVEVYPSGSVNQSIQQYVYPSLDAAGRSPETRIVSDVPALINIGDSFGNPTAIYVAEKVNEGFVVVGSSVQPIHPIYGNLYSHGPTGVFYINGELWIHATILVDHFFNIWRSLILRSPPLSLNVPSSVYCDPWTLVSGYIRSVYIDETYIYIIHGDSNPTTLTWIYRDSLIVHKSVLLSGLVFTLSNINSAEDNVQIAVDSGVVYIRYISGAGSQKNLASVDGEKITQYGIIPFDTLDTSIYPYFNVDGGMLITVDSGKTEPPNYNDKGVIRYWSLNAVGTSTVPLSTIVADICNSSGLESSDINVTDLAGVAVKGYLRSNQMTARAAIEPLAQAFRFDAAESDGVLKFFRRGKSSVATLTVDDFGANASGNQEDPHVTTLQQDNELPIELTVRYMDIDRDYQSGAQRARRLAPDSQQTTTIELPVVLHGDDAKQSAEVLQYLTWTERTKYQFSVPLRYLKLDAGDIITAPIGGIDRRLRLTKATLGDVMALEAVADDASVYVSAATAAVTTSAKQKVTTPGQTVPAFLDIPILRDSDDDADFYLAARGTGTGWSGAAVYKSTDRADWNRTDAITEPSIIGTCTTLLPSGPTTIFDDGSTVNVRLISGELSSVTEEQMANGANTAAIGSMAKGWEIVGFQNATLQGDGTYLLSRFLRGRRGTEWAVGTHAIGDQFVLLESGDLIRPNTSATEINSPRYYRLPSFGAAFTDADEITYTHQAIGKKPLSPVHIHGRRHSPATNDWNITWVRRGRVDWEWRDYVETPLGETSESYEIDIMSGTTVKRTLTATAQTVNYTAAQQTTDFGAVQTTLSVRVYQMSATVGRGYVGTATL
mgnify:CR=1 FL=1